MEINTSTTQDYGIFLNINKSTTEYVVVAMVLTLIIIGATLGNVLVICAVKLERNLHSPGNFLICSLAVTDLLLACLVMPLSALYEITGTWLLGKALCQVWTATDICCCTASILHLCAIALERHRSINNAVKYFTKKRKNGVTFKILLVWLLAICISIPPLLGWEKSTTNKTIKYSNNTKSIPIQCHVGHHPGYTVYAVLGSFYIPLFLLLVVYSRIYYMIHKHIKKSQSRSHLSLLSADAISLRIKNSPTNRGFPLSSRSRVSRKSSGTSIVTYGGRARESVDSRMNTRKLSKQTTGKSSAYHSMSLHSNDATHWQPKHRAFNHSQMTWRNGHVTENCGQIWEKAVDQIRDSKLKNKISLKGKQPEQTLNVNNGSQPLSSNLSAARQKRLSSLCRQLALDDDQHLDKIEAAKSEPNHSDYPLFYFQSFQKGQNINNLKSEHNNVRKTLSENDVTKLKPQKSFSKFIRPRTRTASARVRFKSVTPRDGAHELQNDAKNTPKKHSVSLSGSQNFSKNSLCCLPESLCFKKTKNERVINDLSNRSPLLLHSLSMRAKLKMLRAREIRAIRTLGTIVGGFILCWLPFFIVTVFAPFCDCVIPRALKDVVLWLGYCNSLLNPVLYAAFNHDFHCAFKKLLARRCRIF